LSALLEDVEGIEKQTRLLDLGYTCRDIMVIASAETNAELPRTAAIPLQRPDRSRIGDAGDKPNR